MKTGMEWPAAGIVIVVIAAMLFLSWQDAQVTLGADQVQAVTLGKEIPGWWVSIGELGISWVVKAAIGAVLAGFGATIAAKLWGLYQARQRAKHFQNNYGYNQKQSSPRTPGEMELYRMMLYQQMLQQNGGRPPKPPQMGRFTDDDQEIFI